MLLLLAIPLTTLLIYLVVLVIALGVIYFLLNQLPEPFRRWGIIILVVVVAIILIKLLLGFVGGEPVI
jgi:hypothetical protein